MKREPHMRMAELERALLSLLKASYGPKVMSKYDNTSSVKMACELLDHPRAQISGCNFRTCYCGEESYREEE